MYSVYYTVYATQAVGRGRQAVLMLSQVVFGVNYWL